MKISSSTDQSGVYDFATSDAGKPKKPTEVPSPGKAPETNPSEEPEPVTWPRKTPEILPGKEPQTIPSGPPEIPPPPDFHQTF
jgi:hypothetical protein